MTAGAGPVDTAGTTVLTVMHGPHGAGPAEDAARAEHRAGWEHFLPRLADCLGE